MKTSAHKVIKFWLNKIKLNSLKDNLNKQSILIGAILILFLTIFTYFIRPNYFDYNLGKKNFQNKINNVFKLNIKIDGDITYQIFPSPRVIINDVVINFGKSTKANTEIKRMNILVSPFSLKNLESLNLRKILITNQKIRIHSNELKNYFNYFTQKKKKSFNIINSDIFFLDEQKNKVLFTDVNLKEKISNNKYVIISNINFSENKINLKFSNNFNLEKKLKITVPSLNQSINVKFDKTSSLDNLSGELKLNIFETILLLNFKGKDDFLISKSYVRNKFLNSKIDGKISFKDEFYFDLNLGVNQINLRRLLLYYPIIQQGGVSKKINGRMNISIKNLDTFFGKTKDIAMNLKLENGDIKISNVSANIPENGIIKSNISILNTNRGPNVEFSINFSTKNAKKFLRKFGIYNHDKNEISLFIDGFIDLNRNKIKFKKIIKNNNERVGRNETSIIENSFNQTVINAGILGIFDFFKIKKFIKEIY